MRIAMISEHASPLRDGGPHTYLADLSAALTDLGHEVHVYTRRDDPATAEVVTIRGGIRVVQVPAGPPHELPPDVLLPYLSEYAEWLARHWRDDAWTPDVAHAHFWTSGLAAVTAARQLDIPVVQSFHELGEIDLGAAKPSRSGYERALGRVVDRVVAQNEQEVRGLVRIGVPRAHLTVVPAGVDSDRFTPDGPAVERDSGRPRILSVGRLVERKGFGEVIQAMQYVPGAEVVVVGGPPADQLPQDPGATSLRALAERLRVADRFRLVGAVPSGDLPRWYRSADLFVAAPWAAARGGEPWATEQDASVLEAMACGVPVVGAAVGGLAEAMVDGLTGDLVPARDPRALGSALRRLVNDKVRRFAYATAALDRARQAYSWRRVAAQVGSVYAAVTTLRRGSNSEAMA